MFKYTFTLAMFGVMALDRARPTSLALYQRRDYPCLLANSHGCCFSVLIRRWRDASWLELHRRLISENLDSLPSACGLDGNPSIYLLYI